VSALPERAPRETTPAARPGIIVVTTAILGVEAGARRSITVWVVGEREDLRFPI